MNPMLAAALAYREAGLTPIPLSPRSKRPALGSWKRLQYEMPTEEEIVAWFTTMPDANVGICTGNGLMVVDVDDPYSGLVLGTLGLSKVTEAPCVITARGAHYYFAGQEIPNKVGLFPHVDIRGDGGYVVAPPSVHESGHVYVWERALEGPLPTAPPALYDAIRRPVDRGVTVTTGTDWFVQALVGVAEGGRDQTCTRLAGRLLGAGLPQDAVEIILQGWAERCTPPFPVEEVSKCVSSIAQREGAPDGPPNRLDGALESTLAAIHAPADRRRAVAATHLASLDSLLAGGFHHGDYVLLGARPAVGKTALALQIARQVAKKGQGVLIASLEMTTDALVRRLLSQESQVRAEALKTGVLTDTERKMLQHGADVLRPLPIWVTNGIRTTEQLAQAIDLYPSESLGLVILDYLQLLTGADRDARQRVERASKELRYLALNRQIVCLVLSSLSRDNSDRGDRKPTLSRLRESGELEHDADTVILLSRAEGESATELHVAKQRDGMTGNVSLAFRGATLTFEETK
jgi:replicative DNA helicase